MVLFSRNSRIEHSETRRTEKTYRSGIFPKGKRKKRLFQLFVLLVLLTVLIHVVSMLTVDRSIEYTEIEYQSPAVGADLDGYRVAFVTDTHALPREELQKVVDEINRRQVDLLLLGGDFPNDAAVWRSMEILSGTKTADGIYGVEGNHDEWEDLYEAMQTYGIVPLDNEGVEIRPGLYLGGVRDLWNRRPDVRKAVKDAPQDDFVLLLCHNADVSMRQDLSGVDLMLSGHTHGGQITLFGIWKPALNNVSAYGYRFGGGWTENDTGNDIYVSRGTWTAETVPRIFARPEVTLLTLRSGG